jgi:hypothetical protein
MSGWVSPRLDVRFELAHGELALYYPDGHRFASYVELAQQRTLAQQQAEQERQRAEQERQRAERLAERLRALGIDPEES